jgi:ribonucleoside-diphosphate reductase subunit M1
MLSVESALICFVLFAEVIDDLYKMRHPKTKMPSPMISNYHHAIIMKHADRLNSAIIYDRDFSYNYFGFKVVYA